MHRTALICAISLTGILGLASCAATPADPPSVVEPAAEPATSAETEEAPAEDDAAAESDDAATGGETTIPDGARAGSPEFPFPVPADWEELEPFTQDKIGKDIAMSAVYAHPGDAESAAATYGQLLKDAGFSVADNPVGAITNDASLSVEGNVAGTYYVGGLDFDTDAAGTPRVRINLTED